VDEGDIGNFKVYCEEFAGYVLPRDLYSKEEIMKMLGVKAEHDYSFAEVMILIATGMITGVAFGVMIGSMF